MQSGVAGFPEVHGVSAGSGARRNPRPMLLAALAWIFAMAAWLSRSMPLG
jgi:hypothetical protein